MNLTGQETLPVTQAQAWEALNDIEMLKSSIAGCDALNPIGNPGDGEYEALLSVSIGPVKAKFKGKLKLSDLQPPNSYQLAFEGSGGAAGHGKGTAQVRLESAGPAVTTLHYEANASVGGKIAQIGSRLVDMAAQKMAGDFFAAFNAKLQEKYPPAAGAAVVTTPVPSGGMLQRLLAWLGRLFGSKP